MPPGGTRLTRRAGGSGTAPLLSVLLNRGGRAARQLGRCDTRRLAGRRARTRLREARGPGTRVARVPFGLHRVAVVCWPLHRRGSF